ncbi:MAG: dihydrolipoamide acetyltransferase family protein [Nakamurella sp.]
MSLQVFTLPDLGEGLTEAEIIRWLVAVGDTVAIDAPVAEVETAKAAVEVPSPFGGVVTQLHGAQGATLAVGTPLITIEDGLGTPPPPAAAAVEYIQEERAGSGNVLIGYGTTEPTPSRRRHGRNLAVVAAAPAASAAAVDRPSNGSPTRPAVQSPIVRQLARSRGVDLACITGTGLGGLITRADIVADAVRPASTAQASSSAAPQGRDTAVVTEIGADRRTGLPVRTRIPLRGFRKAVTATLTRSRTEIPEATTWVDVDATALLALRRSLAETGEAPGMLAMVARFVTAGLSRFPELNAKVDTDGEQILHLDGVNLGIAAQTEPGLVVPAVRNAHRLGMRGLHTEIKRLTAAARDGSATAEELTSGSFTLNNYGVLGVDGSAAIINHPEVAILGMGRIYPRAWVVEGEIMARQIVQLSLVFDHRVCDGGTAGGFLRFVADAIENPTAAIADL